MDFSQLQDDKKAELAKIMLTPLNSAAEIKDWARFYLDLELPTENTDPDSTSNPLEAAWYIYETFKNNWGDRRPGAIMISCREGLKTIIVTILELLLMVHFQLEVGHAAAIESQSAIALGYIEGFLLKISPLLDAAGWIPTSSNKRVIRYKTPQRKSPFIKVVICSSKGMNGLHSNVLFLDELDLADKAALKEGQNITGFSRGIHGMMVLVSSYKYSFGNVAEALEKAEERNYKILKWNLIDLTERCPTDRHLPDGPKQDMYTSKNLPLKNLTSDEYIGLPEVEKSKYDFIAQAHAGCVKCPLLGLCKTKLATKDAAATGGFYKPIGTVIQKFRENDPDTAESQLLCRRPGSEGLVYPRFSAASNVITTKQAYETLIGPTTYQDISEATLLYEMQRIGIEFFAGVDWGFSHDFTLTVVAKIPNGEWWLMETYASPGLEFDDILQVSKTFRDKYGPQKWWVDQAMPAYIKSFNKNGMKCPDFTKDVLGGISAVRSKIVNSSGKRSFKIIQNDSNKKTIVALSKHRFQIDGQGNVTQNPADEPGIADICFLPETIIYTKKGAKEIKDIETGDLVLTHTGKFQKVLSKISRQYKGKIVAVNSHCKPLVKSTPNHPFFLSNSTRTFTKDKDNLTGQRRIEEKFSFKPIGEVLIPKGKERKTKPIPSTFFPKIIIKNEPYFINFSKYVPEWIEKDGLLYNKMRHNGKINKNVEITEEIAFMVGYFVAEGSKSGNGSGVHFSGHNKETNVLLLLNEATQQLGVNNPIYLNSKNDNSRNIIISSKPLHNFFNELSKEKNKKFPDFTHDLNRKCLIALLSGYIFGDGHITKNNNGISSNSISKNISFTVHALMAQLGYRPRIKFIKRKNRWKGINGLIKSDMWVVQLNSSDSASFLKEAFLNELIKKSYIDKINTVLTPKQNSCTQIILEDGISSSIVDITTENYSGLVYNLEVENDNSYVANCSAVHNCDNVRYIGQNMWAVKGTQRAMVEYTDDPGKLGLPNKPIHKANDLMLNEITKRLGGSAVVASTTKKKGGFTFSV